MPLPRRCAFTVWDAIFLIAATALGLVGICAVFDCGYGRLIVEIGESIRAANSADSWRSLALEGYGVYSLIEVALLPICFVCTVTVLAVQLRHPRPRWSRLLRQPGAAACISAVAGSAFALVPFALRYLFDVAHGSPWSHGIYVEQLLFFGLPVCGATVLGSWTSLLLSVGWRPVSSWVDRAGRILGFLWIGTVGLAIESFFM
jgi:hypothetical protein